MLRDDQPQAHGMLKVGDDQQIYWEEWGSPVGVRALTGQEPLLVDLSTDPGFAVVRVVAPGCAMRSDRVHSRPRIGG